MTDLVQIGREIISDMFRYGYIDEKSKYFDFNVRGATAKEILQTIKEMIEYEYISDDTSDNLSIYYVSPELISEYKQELNTN